MNIHISLFGSVERYYELLQRTQWQEGHAPLARWLDAPDSLYVIANAFNLCVVLIAWIGSITVLPLYSQMDWIGGTILHMRNRCPLPPLHVQWQYHCNDRVSSWPEPYFDRIADWNTRYARAYPSGDPIHINL
ncbi:hypothetical protein M9H77_21546 [Catharanthus roseus]|uniref:Uncharacterized protein n=1 Tax=Catharanthus roseus TaxID=4058 RepID=A0ACC0AQJ7_CATRO|nr:hypothetical protein M9H77_21546 [Catharanthus roseus]